MRIYVKLGITNKKAVVAAAMLLICSEGSRAEGGQGQGRKAAPFHVVVETSGIPTSKANISRQGEAPALKLSVSSVLHT